jgi:hypothetical protein
MRRVEEIERQISELSNEEFAELRSWLVERDPASWDAQFEVDASAGRLTAFGDAAQRSRAEGKSTRF